MRFACVHSAGPETYLVLLDAPQPYLDSVAGQADAMRIATEGTIDATLTAAQATAVKGVLETLDIPGEFANTGDTRRTVIRRVIGQFLFSQRMEARFGEGWRTRARAVGITLDSTWTSFPQALKDVFIDVRDDFGWGDLGVTGSSTLREILGVISQQWATTPFHVGRIQL